MSEVTLTARYQIRRIDPSDLNFIMRAQRSCQFEMEQLDNEQIEAMLWNQQIEGFILTGTNVRMSIIILREGNVAGLAMFYREGPPVGLWTQAQILWRKTEEYLQAIGITRVTGFVHRNNPKRDKLLRFYRRLGFVPDMVRLGKTI